MKKKAAPPIPPLLTQAEEDRNAVRRIFRNVALETSLEENFDEALELLVGKRPRLPTAAFEEKSRSARQALRAFVTHGPYAEQSRRHVRVGRAIDLATELERASANLRKAMVEFRTELGQYVEGPVLYGAGADSFGPTLFRMAFFGPYERALEPGAPVEKQHKTEFRLQLLQKYGRLIIDSLPPDKGGATNLDVRENGRPLGRLVLWAADMFSKFADPPKITMTRTGRFMSLCLALFALAQRTMDLPESSVREMVEYATPRIGEMQRLMLAAHTLDYDAALRGGPDHAFIKTWTRIDELRREIRQGPPPRKRRRVKTKKS